ncbi:hypothetical protein TSACC_21717 [Terrimicrobium sacchariphilum]|uniref:Uncharacterized protein n=1 Tax=Terrimicrobium sacchariphilum TaxID=690879 RepID=A0A146G8U4_TERSA|nr:hypothetical protein [Terrimicrobium sacchariphilum]GAT33304.1 hypothetical protein TSACC_21717 [Terrimicrobium sacchariphilum]
MSFQTYQRIVAIDPARVADVFGPLWAQFGEVLPDGSDRIRTIGAFWDDEGRTRIRAASLVDGTISPIPLTDGRVAYRCLWQSDVAAAFSAGEIPGATELTEEQFESLRVKEEAP